MMVIYIAGLQNGPGELMEAAAIDGVDWLRVLYCYPDETDDRLLDVIAGTPNICKYLDLPIQHVNDTVLRRMHRRGNKADILRCIKGARERGLTLRTSIIVGFPGETEEQFQELLDVLGEAEFDRLGAFTYSPEEDTPAARMPDQIPEEIALERVRLLTQLQDDIMHEFDLDRLGSHIKVLCEGYDESLRMYFGRSYADSPGVDEQIFFSSSEEVAPGQFVTILAEDLVDDQIHGVAVWEE